MLVWPKNKTKIMHYVTTCMNLEDIMGEKIFFDPIEVPGGLKMFNRKKIPILLNMYLSAITKKSVLMDHQETLISLAK